MGKVMDLSKETPVVSVVLLTYNQEAYIEQAIESVLHQRVSFPYEIIIGEDLGSDGTRDICNSYALRYPFIKVLPREHNLGVAVNWCDCVQHAKGKYIMMLDGDDWWHNLDKMKIQVDFMDIHPECVLCHTEVDVMNMSTGRIIHNRHSSSGLVIPEGMIQKEVLKGRDRMTSSSICLRADSVREHIPFDLYEREQFPCEDWPTILILSAFGEIRYLSVSTTTYRIGQESITNARNYDSISRYWQRSNNMLRCLYGLFPEWGEYKDSVYFETYMYNSLLNAAYKNNDWESARVFSARNPAKRFANICAKYWLSFQLFRIYLTRIK